MATKKRTSKRAPAKRTNSNITAAQRATSAARKARAEKVEEKSQQGEEKSKQAKEAAAKAAVDPRRPLRPVLEQNTRPGAAQPRPSTAGEQIAGLALKFQPPAAAPKPKSAIADPSLYGTNDAKRAQNLSARSAAYAETQRQLALKNKGQLIWMGATKKQVKIRNSGPERFDENGSDTSTQTVTLEDVKTKDELMSWLADEKTFNEIKKRMTESGIAVQNYDDVAKLWSSVIDQAAATYTSTGKKVTPWALLSLRGKSMVNGRPAPKTTTSTSVEEMDPAQAKVMIKNSLSQLLGRDPRKEEIEDFISKAQTIAKQNPQITKTTTQYDISGDPVSQSSVSSGGQDVVTAKAQLAAEEQAKQSEDYAAYQGAGVYMPWLMDALSAPV